MQSDNTDEELQKDCAVTLALLGNALLPEESIEAALNTVKEVKLSPAAQNLKIQFIGVVSYFCSLAKVLWFAPLRGSAGFMFYLYLKYVL